ncbi:MAG: hypothetical protein HQL39_04085 [Alphaproteobacteria bacterium]|nr:hypothetical protein [Alphaproteobacteria bacterium]
MNDLTALLLHALSFTQFSNTILVGSCIGAGFGVLTRMFQPWLTERLAGIADFTALSYTEWAIIGIALAFLAKIIIHRKMILDRNRELLNLIEEAIRRGKLGQAQAKQIYHALALRLANTADMADSGTSSDARES